MKINYTRLWTRIAFVLLVILTIILSYQNNECEESYKLVSSSMVWYTNPNYTKDDQVICITDKSLIEWKVEKQTNDLLFVNSGTGERMQKHSCQKVDTFNYNQ